MENGNGTAPTAPPDARAALTSRVIPQMTLSTAESHHTRPLAPIPATDPAERAAQRFAVEGNAVITGGAGTLALASARALLEHGASGVCLMDLQAALHSPASISAIKELKSSFPSKAIHTVPVDVTSDMSVQNAFTVARSFMPTIDILCCFAGIVGCVPSVSSTSAQFKNVVDVNLNGSFLCAQAAAKHMIDSGKGGSILFTASVSAHKTNFPQPQAAYNASKAAVSHLTRNLAAEWAVHGIRVNCLSPGYMDTILNEGESLKPMRDIWAASNPMGRMGAIEEITGPVVLVSSRRAGRYMNGSELLVDGGMSCF